MKKIKTCVLAASVLLLPLLAQAKDPNVKAYCSDVWKQATPGWTTVASTHGVTIINKTPTPLIYDIYFDNQIQYPKMREMPLDYSEAPYTPNAHQEHHLRVEAGQTLYFGEVTIEKLAGFPRRGHYKTKTLTTVMFAGHLLDQCVHFNSIDII